MLYSLWTSPWVCLIFIAFSVHIIFYRKWKAGTRLEEYTLLSITWLSLFVNSVVVLAHIFTLLAKSS